MTRDPFESLFEQLDRTRNLSDAQIGEMFSSERLDLNPTLGRHSSGERWRPRLWRKGSVIATVAVLIVGGTAAAITLSRGPVLTVANMTCYQGDSLHSTGNVVSYKTNPLAYCSQLLHWKTSSKSKHERGSLCLLTDGSLAVFPPSRSTDLCKSLGLVKFNGHVANPNLARFQIATENYFSVHQCQSEEAARRAVLRLLRSNGVEGWKVKLTGSTSPKACATLAFLVNSSEVDLVGIRFGP